MPSNRALVIPAVLAGILLLIVAVLYFVDRAANLPSFIPGSTCPKFLPIIGPLDDVVAVVLLMRYAARAIPRDVPLEAWPAEPRLLERLLGAPRKP